jgi:hypothetical protein
MQSGQPLHERRRPRLDVAFRMSVRGCAAPQRSARFPLALRKIAGKTNLTSPQKMPFCTRAHRLRTSEEGPMAHDEHTLSHQDVVKAIIIDQDIHEGLWTLHINFDVAASHGPRVRDPCLSVTIKGVGIMRAAPTDPFAVDAALINPKPEPVEDTVHITAAVNGSQGQSSMQFCRDVYRHIAVQSPIKTPTKPG